MAKFIITKPVDFGPWTIGDKNYGPACPSCHVPINNYAPKVGQVVEGNIETRNYYWFDGTKKVLKTGKGISWEIATNGPASTQAQRSIQFITEDHLQPYEEPSTNPQNPEPPTEPEPPVSESSDESMVGKTACWICENWIAVIVFLILAIAIFTMLNKSQS